MTHTAPLLQLLLDNSHAEMQMLPEMSVPRRFEEQFYIHAVILIRKVVSREKLSIAQNTIDRTIVVMSALLVQKDLDATMKRSLLGPLPV